jgi:zinc transport system substrate-binding protein
VRARIVLIACLVVGLCVACGQAETSTGDAERRVLAAFYPLAYAVERIAPRSAVVENLTPPGVEPHDLELSARDVERVRDADLVFYVGGGFQPALEDAVQDARGRAVDLLDGVDLLAGADADAHGSAETADHEDGAADPHVWLDPIRFAGIVERIGRELGRPGPAERLGRELRALDGELTRGLSDCERRELVTSHAAFGYLADRYGLRQIAITGLSPEAEPTPRELERVVEQVEEHRATAIFSETLVSPRLAETVARETGAATAVLDPLEGLTESQADAGEDYFSVMRSNLTALRAGLGCR